jgi:hypothetical protein
MRKIALILLLCFFLISCSYQATQNKIITAPHSSELKNYTISAVTQAAGQKNVTQQKDATQEKAAVKDVPAVKENPALTPKTWYKPKPGTSWQLQLSGEINTNYDADMYDIDLAETPQETIDFLHAQGKKVICYFSAGSAENYREDASQFPSSVLGNTIEGWPDERWLDVSQFDKFSFIMEKRLDLAAQKKCDGVDPDNVDSYSNDNWFSVTYSEQLTYNRWLAAQAHKRGLSIGLKNDVEQIDDLVSYFDFAVNEECFDYDECDSLLPFIEQDKAVFGVEYELDTSDFCSNANRMRFSFLKMELDLDGGRISC